MQLWTIVPMLCSISSVLTLGAPDVNFPGNSIQWGGMKVRMSYDGADGAVAKTNNEQCPANYLTVSPESVYFADENGQKIDALFSLTFDSSNPWDFNDEKWYKALFSDDTSGKKMWTSLYTDQSSVYYHYMAYINGPNVTEIDMEDYIGSDTDLSHQVGPYAVNFALGFIDTTCASNTPENCDGSDGEKFVVFVLNARDQDGNPPKKVKDNVFTFKDPEMKIELWDHYLVQQQIGTGSWEDLGKTDMSASIGANGEIVVSLPVELVAYTPPPTKRMKRATDRAENYQIGWEVILPQCESNNGDKMAAGVFLAVAAVFFQLFA
jgi:hypothetical protein